MSSDQSRTTVPGYWMNETSGVLRPAVEAYLNDHEMTSDQIAAMRAYLRQWIFAPGFIGEGVDELRAWVGHLNTRHLIRLWLDDALEEGIDPL